MEIGLLVAAVNLAWLWLKFKAESFSHVFVIHIKWVKSNGILTHFIFSSAFELNLKCLHLVRKMSKAMNRIIKRTL